MKPRPRNPTLPPTLGWYLWIWGIPVTESVVLCTAGHTAAMLSHKGFEPEWEQLAADLKKRSNSTNREEFLDDAFPHTAESLYFVATEPCRGNSPCVLPSVPSVR